MARPLFFESSRSAYRSVTEIFDFVWTTATALWNLRWQVAGLMSVLPDITVDTLDRRFIAGSEIRGANLKRACVQLSWPEQQRQFAKFLLIELFAIYEGWLGKTLSNIGHARLEKQFQFPTETGTAGNQRGVGAALRQITPSPVLDQAFYAKLILHPKNCIQHIEPLLKTYRCFKECRNSLMHSNGLADPKAADAYQHYKVLVPSDIGIKEMPRCPIITIDNPIELSLRGVVGFSDIILRLITTLDAEFARSRSAEREFTRQWQAKFGRHLMLKTKDQSQRNRQVSRLVQSLGFPKPAGVIVIEQFLLDNHLVS